MSLKSTNGTTGSRTILWCIPRTISTALSKCLSAIPDNEVWFEPYTYSFLVRVQYNLHCGDELPMEYGGNEEKFQQAADLLGALAQSKFEPDRLPYASVKRDLESSTSKHVFLKDMGSGVPEGFYQFLPKGYRHTFLIRNPVRSINSYRTAMYKQFSGLGLLTGKAADERTYDVQRDDRFFPPGFYVKELYDLWKYVKENIDSDPIVIDGDDLLMKPAETLRAYCKAVGLPYNESLLQWDSSTDSLKTWKAAGNDMVLDLVNFYGTAMRSSEFFPPSTFPSRHRLTPDVIRCSNEVMKYFEEMYECRIKM